MKRKNAYALLSMALAAGVMMPLSACELHSKEKAPQKAQAVQEEAVAMAAHSDGLKIEDVREGTGAIAKKGETVKVNYRGTLTNGKEFDSSYNKEPFKFKLGAGQVIEGWDKGIQGMKVGGKRILVIPPEQAYGASGYPPVIPENATLKFEVELLGVE
jgi:FKBP-type peptidyl-prolyl cis-trans isomerase